MNKPKLKINELFSGIGAQIQGLKNIDLFDNEVVCISDIDKDAMLSYAIIHCGLTKEYINKKLQEDDIPFDKIADWLSNKNIGYDFKKEQPYDWYKLIKTNKNRYELMKYYLACTLSKNMGDISLIQELPYADLWTYSFPCQDISVAGKQAGIEHGKTRSGLLYEVERLLEVAQEHNELPKYLMLENVKNLVGKKFKAQFDEWIQRLDELGFNTYWQVLNAKNYGIPQNRERVFGISIRKDIDTGYVFPEPFDSGLRLKDLLEDEVDEKFYISNEKVSKLLLQLKDKQISNTIRSGDRGSIDRHSWDMVCVGNVNPSQKGMNGKVYAGEIAPTLTTNKGEGSKMCVPCLTPDRLEKRQNGRRFKEDGEPMFTLTGQDRHGVLQVGNYRESENFDNPQTGRVYSADGISPTLNTMQGGDRQPKILEAHNIGDIYTNVSNEFQRGLLEGISHCLKANQHDAGVVLNYRIRKLTPKECFRLMGFYDEDFQKCVDIGMSNSQLYKQAGNSIVVDCIELLMEHLYKAQYYKDYVCKDENFTIPHK